jgi:hypothetical protein
MKPAPLKAEVKKAFKKLLKQKGKQRHIEQLAVELHHEVFAVTDCLACANCCKSIPPIVTGQDARRIAKYLGMKEGDFADTYLRIDEDGDQVMKATPCPFLDEQNYCGIYEVRPKACAEYPHTDMRDFCKHPALHLQNAQVCPAAARIVAAIVEKCQ